MSHQHIWRELLLSDTSTLSNTRDRQRIGAGIRGLCRPAAAGRGCGPQRMYIPISQSGVRGGSFVLHVQLNSGACHVVESSPVFWNRKPRLLLARLATD